MEEVYAPENVKNRLILAGLKELDKHGVVDFSLRRVAIEAGVSCAAPYRHFKDKDELISSILSYVMEGWILLSGQIGELYADDVRGLITELSSAGLLFFVANGNFRTVITVAPQLSGKTSTEAMSDFERPFAEAINRFCADKASADKRDITFRVLSIIYGAITLVNDGYESCDEAAIRLRSAVSDILGKYLQ